MPKIMALKEMDGGLWARLPSNFIEAEGPVYLYTQAEIDQWKDWFKQGMADQVAEFIRNSK